MVSVNAADDENEAVVAIVHPRPQSLPAFVGRGAGVSGVELPGAFVVPGVGAASRAVSSLSSCAVSSLASRGGRLTKQIRQKQQGQGGVRHHCPVTSVVEAGGGEKRPKILLIANGGLSQKAMDRMAESIESGGQGDSGSNNNNMISMLSMQMQMQMQQQAQQLSMQQQMFQQQMHMQMAAMEKRAETSEAAMQKRAEASESAMQKRAETSEKYLRRIAKTIGRNKRKRVGDYDEDDSPDDDE